MEALRGLDVAFSRPLTDLALFAAYRDR
jgi:hypothetical protein